MTTDTHDIFDDKHMLEADYYLHKTIQNIIDTPREQPEKLIIQIDMLEKLMKGSQKITEKDIEDMEKHVKEYMEKISKNEKIIDKSLLQFFKYNKKLEILLKHIFEGNEKEGNLEM